MSREHLAFHHKGVEHWLQMNVLTPLVEQSLKFIVSIFISKCDFKVWLDSSRLISR